MDGIQKSSKRGLPVLLAALFCVFLFSGCYTKLMTYQGETMRGREDGACEDGCPEEVAANSSRREVCVWERDMFGYPEMRCYNTLYHSSWMYFHSTPWWYRSSFGWYDTRGCPPRYYFDSFSGTCRYYGHRYPPANPGHPGGGGGGGGGGGSASTGKDRPHSTPGVIPAPPASTISEQPPMFQGSGLKQLSPAPAPSTPSAPSAPAQDGALSKPQEEQKTPPAQPEQRPRPKSKGRGM